jgi:alpha-L-rhamnosidase
MNICVPVGCSATVFIPAENPQKVKEGGRNIKKSKVALFQKIENGYAVYEIKSGQYNFESNN